MRTPQNRMIAVTRMLALGVALAPLSLATPSLLAQTTDQNATPTQAAPGTDAPMHGGHRMDPEKRQEHMLKELTKKLNLSQDQVAQVKAIQADSLQQAQALHADTSTQGADRHQKMMDLHQQEQGKIRAVLNSDQQAKFDAMAQRHEEHMHEHGQGGAPTAPPAQ